MSSMHTTLYRFQSFLAVDKATFTCPSCSKEKRTRTFRVECTTNPFNVGEHGRPLTPTEVRKQSQARVALERSEFLTEPLCKACEDRLSYSDRCSLSQRRRSGLGALSTPSTGAQDSAPQAEA